jgi:cytochrome b561
MQLRDNGLRFSPITIVLHWLVAALLFSILGLGVAIAQSPGEAWLVQLQNLLGTLLFLISIYRFWARVTSFHPLPVGSPNPVEVIVARSVATALALAMVLLPVAVWLSRAAAGVAVELPGGLALPTLISPNEQVTAFLAGLVLHLFGAFKNHFVLKNLALRRILGKQVEL